MTKVVIAYNFDRGTVVISRDVERDYLAISDEYLYKIEPANLKWAWPQFKMTDEQAETILARCRDMSYAASRAFPWQQAMPDPFRLEV